MKNKLNIMKAKPPVTEDEIKRYMNFDSVMQAHHKQLNHASTFKGISAIVGSASLVAIAVYLFVSDPSSKQTGNEKPSTQIIAPTDSTHIPKKEEETSSPIDVEQPKGTKLKKTQASIAEKKDSTSQTSTNPVMAPIEYDYHEAEPIHGYPHLYEYFSHELRYPAAAIKDSISGTVSVSFVINDDGKPGKIEIQNSLGPLFDEESIRLISNMPSWKPAQLNGKPVSAKISMPLTFTIVKPAKAK